MTCTLRKAFCVIENCFPVGVKSVFETGHMHRRQSVAVWVIREGLEEFQSDFNLVR